jgi:hypothetical protein
VQAQPGFVIEEVVVYIHPMTFLLGLSVSVCRRQANAYIGESLKESGSPRHVGTCIDPSAMHGTSAHSLHTILAALVLLRKRTCGKKRVRNCVTVGCKERRGGWAGGSALRLEESGNGYAQHFLRGNERRDCYSRHYQEKPQHMISDDSEDGARAAISSAI